MAKAENTIWSSNIWVTDMQVTDKNSKLVFQELGGHSVTSGCFFTIDSYISTCDKYLCKDMTWPRWTHAFLLMLQTYYFLIMSTCVMHEIPICYSMKNLTVMKLSSSLLFTLPWPLCSGAGSVCLFLAILMFYTTAFSVQVCLWCGVQTLLRDIAWSYYTRLCSLRPHFIYQKM